MIVSKISSQKNGSKVEVSALVDGYRLWYRFPDKFSTSSSADSFLAASFFAASQSASALEVVGPETASPKLLKNFKRLQLIFGTWKPDLTPFAIDVRSKIPTTPSDMVFSFFSGGVDGLYTLLSNENEITHLVYINGFDFHVSPEEFAVNVQRLEESIAPFGKEIIPVETNFYEFNEFHCVGRQWSHGACLASVALLLQPKKCIVPSSYSYRDLRPWGTHPLTDNLWSTEVTEIVHDEANLERAEKIEMIAGKSPAILDKLIVCWKYPDRNCGKCLKCIRTMIILKILGIESNTFIDSISEKSVSNLSVPQDYRPSFEELLSFAKVHGDRSMEQALKKCLSIPTSRKIIGLIDDTYLNGSIRSCFRLLKKRLGDFQ